MLREQVQVQVRLRWGSLKVKNAGTVVTCDGLSPAAEGRIASVRRHTQAERENIDSKAWGQYKRGIVEADRLLG